MQKIVISFVLLLLGLQSIAQTPNQNPDKSLKFNEFARFYACMDQDSNSSVKYTETNKVWLRNKETFTRFWDSASIVRINPMTEFAKTDLTILSDSVKSLFYPFSGPDFLHANIFFPNAQTIVMIGLERVGKVPDVQDLDDKKLGTFFRAVRQSLDSIFIWGYFMTNDMSKDFARSLELKGLTPVIMLTMAKAGFEIQNVKKVTINPKGVVVDFLQGKKDLDDPNDTYISGVEIKYRKLDETRIRTLYYFSHNASDDNLKRTPEFLKFLADEHFDCSYFKAASYLCGYLNSVRKEALKSKYVFQDDSGIEFKYFDEKIWDRQLWGKYTRPIKQFKWAIQPKLVEVYKTEPNVKPIPFGIGYCARFKQSNLMLFTRK